MTTASIGEHGLIGNMNSAALVNVFGEIDFYCFPEFDSPTVFASLLDTDQDTDQHAGQAGCFSLGPAGDRFKGSQIYLPDTNVLLTRFLADESLLEVCDWMPVAGVAFRHCIMRAATAVRGDVDVELRCRPAFDYARMEHVASECKGGVHFQPGSNDAAAMRLLGSVELKVDDNAAVACFHLKAGDSAYFLFSGAEDESIDDLVALMDRELKQTCDYWKRWVSKSTYKGRWRGIVTRSALVLKLLTSERYGSLVAAPTFGLPEVIGGVRNWDYRYAWMRDASFSIYALTRLGFVEEGRNFAHWLKGRLAWEGNQGPLQVMYRLDGGTELDEVSLDNLRGYRDSRPVRIGNGASKQLQLDIYGELFDSVYLSSKYGDSIPYEDWEQMKAVLRWLADHWRDPDEGIWEVRGGRKQFLHSRLMCWVAFDRTIRLGGKRSLAGPFGWMEDCRDAIVSDIHENFFDADLQAFVQYKGAKEVDASTLLMPLMRFISPSDPRWLSTLELIERRLAVDTIVKRYSSENAVDGLAGREGGFVACSFWLVEAMARSHRLDEARLLFEKLLSQANPLGLFAEELSVTGEHLGNFPQALSHLALISAATYLDRNLDTDRTRAWA